MKKHRDLLTVLRSNRLRITPVRRLLLQFVLDHKKKHLSLKDIYDFLDVRLPGVDRSSIYRNIETFKSLDILQELNLPMLGKRFQYVFDTKVHHFYICKACGILISGNNRLFKQIEAALGEVPGFSRANLSAVFYGYCLKCSQRKESEG